MSQPSGLIARRPTLAVFSVTLTAIVGGGILALPVALVAFGPIAAGLVTLLMGLVNVFTIGALATAISRSSAVVAGRGRITSLNSEHLGTPAAVVASFVGTINPAMILISYLLGLATTLPEMLFGSALDWLLALGAVIVAVVVFQARDLFVSSAAVIAVINLILLAGMLIVLLVHADYSLLTQGPQIALAGGWDQALGLVFGAVLFCFFGHLVLFSIAQPVLQSDPSGRALRRGSTAAMLAATGINAAWVVACLSAVPASRYLTQTSTGLGLLAEVVGPHMQVMGLAFLILAPGLAAVSTALQLSNSVDERLPKLRSLSAVLTPGWSAEIADPRSGAVVIIGQIGQELVATAHRGRRRVSEGIPESKWNAGSLLRDIGLTRRGTWVRLRVEGEQTNRRVHLESSLPIKELLPRRARPDFLDDNADAQRLLRLCTKQPADSADLAELLGVEQSQAVALIDHLVAEGKLVRGQDGLCRPVLGDHHSAGNRLVSGVLAQLVHDEQAPRRAPGVLNMPLARRTIVALPVVGCVAMVVVLEESGFSFAAVIALTAMATMMLLAGGFPLLLNISLMHRAERPVRAGRLLQSAALNWLFFVGFAAICLLYAVVIYDNWLNRLVALAVFAVFVLLFVTARRRNAFAARSALHLELSRDGSVSVFALDHCASVQTEAPSRAANHDRRLVVSVPDGISSRMLLTAIDGDTVPARLARYEITSGGETVVGRLTDVMGDEVEVGTGEVCVRWTLV